MNNVVQLKTYQQKQSDQIVEKYSYTLRIEQALDWLKGSRRYPEIEAVAQQLERLVAKSRLGAKE